MAIAWGSSVGLVTSDIYSAHQEKQTTWDRIHILESTPAVATLLPNPGSLCPSEPSQQPGGSQHNTWLR